MKKEECRESVQTVEKVRAALPEEAKLRSLADLFKVLGDPTRVRILYALAESEVCVCDLAAILGMTPSAISHQLKTLKEKKLVDCRRDGKSIYYALADDHVRLVFTQGMEHVCE